MKLFSCPSDNKGPEEKKSYSRPRRGERKEKGGKEGGERHLF